MSNITVQYEPGAAAYAARLFGFAPAEEDLARLAGALEGATVKVAARTDKHWLYLSIQDARFSRYETSIRQDSAGNLFAYIHHAYVAGGQSGRGIGLQAFLQQVQGAQRLGIQRFELFAAGYAKAVDEIGYYVWARFGFDAPLRMEERLVLPPSLRGAQNINELFRRGGSQWWKLRGDARSMRFDLADDSAMMQIFKDYLAEKGFVWE